MHTAEGVFSGVGACGAASTSRRPACTAAQVRCSQTAQPRGALPRSPLTHGAAGVDRGFHSTHDQTCAARVQPGRRLVLAGEGRGGGGGDAGAASGAVPGAGALLLPAGFDALSTRSNRNEPHHKDHAGVGHQLDGDRQPLALHWSTHDGGGGQQPAVEGRPSRGLEPWRMQQLRQHCTGQQGTPRGCSWPAARRTCSTERPEPGVPTSESWMGVSSIRSMTCGKSRWVKAHGWVARRAGACMAARGRPVLPARHARRRHRPRAQRGGRRPAAAG